MLKSLFAAVLMVAAAPAPEKAPSRAAAYKLEIVSSGGRTELVTFAEGREGTITRKDKSGAVISKLGIIVSGVGDEMIRIEVVDIKPEKRTVLGAARVHLKGSFEIERDGEKLSLTYVEKR